MIFVFDSFLSNPHVDCFDILCSKWNELIILHSALISRRGLDDKAPQIRDSFLVIEPIFSNRFRFVEIYKKTFSGILLFENILKRSLSRVFESSSYSIFIDFLLAFRETKIYLERQNQNVDRQRYCDDQRE